LTTLTVDFVYDIAKNYKIIDSCGCLKCLCLLTDSHLVIVNISSQTNELFPVMGGYKVFKLDNYTVAIAVERGFMMLEINSKSSFEVKDVL